MPGPKCGAYSGEKLTARKGQYSRRIARWIGPATPTCGMKISTFDTRGRRLYFRRPAPVWRPGALPLFARYMGGGFRLSTLPRVLIVDESAESREVLRTALERHGATTIESNRPEQAIAMTSRFRPQLIVLDAESDHSTSGSATVDLCAAASRTATPIVILGTLRRRSEPPAGSEVVAKPYHYGQLIRRIESLLAAA